MRILQVNITTFCYQEKDLTEMLFDFFILTYILHYMYNKPIPKISLCQNTPELQFIFQTSIVNQLEHGSV